MLGNRGSSDGIEVDAFDRKARAVIAMGRGALRKIKRQFNKRQRQAAKQDLGLR